GRWQSSASPASRAPARQGGEPRIVAARAAVGSCGAPPQARARSASAGHQPWACVVAGHPAPTQTVQRRRRLLPPMGTDEARAGGVQRVCPGKVVLKTSLVRIKFSFHEFNNIEERTTWRKPWKGSGSWT